MEKGSSKKLKGEKKKRQMGSRASWTFRKDGTKLGLLGHTPGLVD